MLDALLLIGMTAGLGLAVLWTQPGTLRYVAARMWARAHAIEVARKAYQEMVAKVEDRA